MPAMPLSMYGLARFGTVVLDGFGMDSAHVLGASFGTRASLPQLIS
jgi:hypothetical protein